MRVVVELKKGAVAELVLNQLFHNTRLQVSTPPHSSRRSPGTARW
jgi:DNA gyrase/topoisomerase IV subunit A